MAGHMAFSNPRLLGQTIHLVDTIDDQIIGGKKEFLDKATFDKDVHFRGNITVDGEGYESSLEVVKSESDLMLLREGSTTTLGNGYSGLLIQNVYEEDNVFHSLALVVNSGGELRVGKLDQNTTTVYRVTDDPVDPGTEPPKPVYYAYNSETGEATVHVPSEGDHDHFYAFVRELTPGTEYPPIEATLDGEPIILLYEFTYYSNNGDDTEPLLTRNEHSNMTNSYLLAYNYAGRRAVTADSNYGTAMGDNNAIPTVYKLLVSCDVASAVTFSVNDKFTVVGADGTTTILGPATIGQSSAGNHKNLNVNGNVNVLDNINANGNNLNFPASNSHRNIIQSAQLVNDLAADVTQTLPEYSGTVLNTGTTSDTVTLNASAAAATGSVSRAIKVNNVTQTITLTPSGNLTDSVELANISDGTNSCKITVQKARSGTFGLIQLGYTIPVNDQNTFPVLLGTASTNTDKAYVSVPTAVAGANACLGLVKSDNTADAITIASDTFYHSVPIVSGVPYYHDTTYNDFVGTDGTDPGVRGLVPAPTALDGNKFLRGDGSWEQPTAANYQELDSNHHYNNFKYLVLGSGYTSANPSHVYLKEDGTWEQLSISNNFDGTSGIVKLFDFNFGDPISQSINQNTVGVYAPLISTTTYGVAKLVTDTTQTVAAETVSTTASRSYAVQLFEDNGGNNTGELVVNVPWTDSHVNGTAARLTTDVEDPNNPETVYVVGAMTQTTGADTRSTGVTITDNEVSAVSFTATSVRAKKKNIKKFKKSGLDLINSVEVCSYNYRKKFGNPDKVHIGFIADDTDELLAPEHKTMDYTNCIGILIKAVQELSKEVSELKEKLNDK